MPSDNDGVKVGTTRSSCDMRKLRVLILQMIEERARLLQDDDLTDAKRMQCHHEVDKLFNMYRV